jgi:hypothetical protein
MKSANLALRFVLELCILFAVGLWGVQTGSTTAAKIALGLGTPLLAAAIWGSFIAPRARWRARDPLRLVLELVVFGVAAAALLAVGRPLLALLFVLAVVINELLLRAWGQRAEGFTP